MDFKGYCIERKTCKCNKCNLIFNEHAPLNYESVCFETESGEKFFLPTYGENGYLDLLKKLVPGWNEKDEITAPVCREFIARLNEITPYKVDFQGKTICPGCKSEDIIVVDRCIENECSFKWLEIREHWCDGSV